MTEAFDDQVLSDHKDSVLYMMTRRVINGQYAEHEVDFNLAGLEVARQFIPPALMPNSVIVDIGSSSGSMIAEAAESAEIRARIVCIEPDQGALEMYQSLSSELKEHASFIQAAGEAIPLKDNSAQGATLHNVIFRAQDAAAVLSEIKRVVVPGGFVAISSNAKGHAYWRHEFERIVAERVMDITGMPLRIPTPPAEGHYLEDLPGLFAQVGDLAVQDDLYVSQDTKVIITRGQRLENYLDSIKYSVANTDLSGEHRSTWRSVVDSWLKPHIETEIDKFGQIDKQRRLASEPFFADTIRRGMFVLINSKKE